MKKIIVTLLMCTSMVCLISCDKDNKIENKQQVTKEQKEEVEIIEDVKKVTEVKEEQIQLSKGIKYICENNTLDRTKLLYEKCNEFTSNSFKVHSLTAQMEEERITKDEAMLILEKVKVSKDELKKVCPSEFYVLIEECYKNVENIVYNHKEVIIDENGLGKPTKEQEELYIKESKTRNQLLHIFDIIIKIERDNEPQQ